MISRNFKIIILKHAQIFLEHSFNDCKSRSIFKEHKNDRKTKKRCFSVMQSPSPISAVTKRPYVGEYCVTTQDDKKLIYNNTDFGLEISCVPHV